ncbi:HAD-IA family hydrolase [Candidatus Pelagibacter sp. Uisw_092]|uniref:HAD family hydrolase n=1 Tax=Candidatus Pelagibacter sp. Uisw_092 TaxID=3230979 RepID=UPI0039E836F6
MKNFKAIIFGSIGTVLETSDIQRKSFNKAFKKFGLNWYWSKNEYKKLLEKSGGENRLSNYAKIKNIRINTLKLRNLKTKFFNNYLNRNELKPRAGVINVIKFCKKNNIKLGFASSTSINNINSIFFALKNTIRKKDFDFIGNNKLALRKKPYPDIYKITLKKLNLKSKDCLAIEDTEESMKSALNAKIRCVAFPGKFHEKEKFKGSHKITKKLINKDIFF